MMTVRMIAECAGAYFGMTYREISGPFTDRSISRARHAAMYLSSRSGHSYSHIGRVLGGRDPATVRYGVACAARRIAACPAFCEAMEQIALAAQTLDTDAAARFLRRHTDSDPVALAADIVQGRRDVYSVAADDTHLLAATVLNLASNRRTDCLLPALRRFLDAEEALQKARLTEREQAARLDFERAVLGLRTAFNVFSKKENSDVQNEQN